MNITNYNSLTINSFFKNITGFLEMLSETNSYNMEKDKNIYFGIKVMLQILSFFYLLKVSEIQMNSYLEKSYILYIEYSEQVYRKKVEPLHTPMLFVYNVLIGNIKLNEYKESEKLNKCSSGETPFIKKISIWTELIMFKENNHLSIDNRIYYIENFLYSYLHIFTTSNKFDAYRAFLCMQQKLKQCSHEKYSHFLTSFLKYFSNKPSITTKPSIQKLCFYKMLNEQEQFETMLENANCLEKMNKCINWVFN